LGALLALGGGLTVREVCAAWHSYGRRTLCEAHRRSQAMIDRDGARRLTLIALSGIGGFGYQHYDWDKHNAVLSDLVHESWPVGYTDYGHPVALVYYIAYYSARRAGGKTLGLARRQPGAGALES
jgi:hypothetical protein